MMKPFSQSKLRLLPAMMTVSLIMLALLADAGDSCKSRLGYEATGVPDKSEEALMSTVITKNGKLVATIEAARPVSFSPDGGILLLADAMADDDCRHFLLNIAAGEYQKELKKWREWKIGSRWHSQATWSADGKTITLAAEGMQIPPVTFEVSQYCRPNAPAPLSFEQGKPPLTK
jgi:hypothetical protein